MQQVPAVHSRSELQPQAEHSFVAVSQHWPARQSAFCMQQGTHWLPRQHCPAAMQSASTQHAPGWQVGVSGCSGGEPSHAEASRISPRAAARGAKERGLMTAQRTDPREASSFMGGQW